MSGLEGLLLGRVLGGRYRIEEVIGRGGMGAVYRALDERLGRRVAVKVITAAMGDDPETRRRVRARFHREARSAAALPHHPNVVPVYDYGTDEEVGLDFIVMELLQGHDLATRLQRAGAPPLATALRILREAARGLAVGHRAGLIHRDVKPGNIFLAQDDDELRVRVVDFGIAKLVDDEDTANQLTQDGRIPHSPAYASPEQLRGLSNLTPASDVFSLGAVGFQLLTGERPFSEADRNRMSLGMPVPPPSLRSHNPAIPSAFDEIVRRSLAFDPTDRYPDATALAADIDRALRELSAAPIEPYSPLPALPELGPESAPYREADDDRTQILDASPDDERTQLMEPEPVGAAPVPAGATRTGSAPPRRPTRHPLGAPRRQRSVAPWVWSIVLLTLAAVGVWAVLDGGGPRLAEPPLPADTVLADTMPPEDSVPEAPDPRDINRRGLIVYNEGRFEEALALFQRAAAIDPASAEFRQNIGITLARLGRPDDAAAALRSAIDRDSQLATPYGALAQIELARGDTLGTIALLEDYLDRAPPSDARTLAARQLEALRIERELLGEPVDTVVSPIPGPSAEPE